MSYFSELQQRWQQLRADFADHQCLLVMSHHQVQPLVGRLPCAEVLDLVDRQLRRREDLAILERQGKEAEIRLASGIIVHLQATK